MSDYSFPKNLRNSNLYLVGIKGTGMAAMAEILLARGARVGGCDVAERFYTDTILEELGISFDQGFGEENLPAEIDGVIYSAAYSPETHGVLGEAKRRGLPLWEYTEALGALSEGRPAAAVAGVHGKTTTTALAGSLVKALGLPSTVLVGSAVSGFGNVAWGATKKVTELGGKVVTLSGPDGFIHDEAGIDGEKIDYMLKMRASGRDRVEDYAERFKVPFHANARPWGVECDIALPCACENEMDEHDAKNLVAGGCTCVAEGANMPVTPEAVDVLMEGKVLYAPGKASNAGGVACSGLEMEQNSTKTRWTAEKVDARLHEVLSNIHESCIRYAEMYGTPGNYINGANIAGFKKVAAAMLDQGHT